jgi:peroxiredoxin Q/BCP
MELSKAPYFELKDKDGKNIKLNNIKADYIVVYFYPKDDTPGCTIEANEFTNYINDFRNLKTEVIGISGGDDKSKKNFCNKYDLKITLLSDRDFKVSKEYQSYGEKSFMGKKFNGIFRNTYVLNKEKKIIKAYKNISAKGHAKEVLDFIKNL